MSDANITDGDHTEESTEDGVAVTFHPQEWVDTGADAHDWGRRQLIPARDHEPPTFVVPRADAMDDTGVVFADESYEANRLQAHPSAPDWVNDWDGPYYVRTEEQ